MTGLPGVANVQSVPPLPHRKNQGQTPWGLTLFVSDLVCARSSATKQSMDRFAALAMTVAGVSREGNPAFATELHR